jgi:hypothetical protein
MTFGKLRGKLENQ